MTNRTFPTRTATYILIAFGVAVLLPWQSSPAHSAGEKSAAQTPIDFNRQIRPILSESCFTCHGPDEKERKAKLRLDTREGGLKELRDGGFAIVPGHANKSELLVRITTKAASERMPPPKTNKRLTPEQIDLLRRWIDEGAKWSEHWAFVAPKRSPLPRVANPTWPRNAIDHFILARLERAGLKPSPEADAIRLIRRVTLDLTGLPPTPAEVDAFLADKSTNAYEKVVDRLLASPHFGERMAVEWLDAARYADTHGYHIDAGRDMTRWRDWVITAFNENLPFDRFTVEQLAGDLLPGATVRQKVASGFNRNHMINFEGGAIPAEYHNNYIVDRINTTSTVWLGLTTACAQCHDHKYDPISQKEYYQLYAFFHNVPENGLDGSRGNAAPVLKAPTPAQAKRLRELDAAIQETERKLATPDPKLDEAQAAWERTALGGRTEWVFLDLKKAESRGGAKLTPQSDQSLLASGPNPATDAYTVVLESSNERNFTALRLEALPHKSLKGQGPGRSVNGNIVLTDVRLSYQPANKSKPPTPIKLKAASADFSQQDFPIRNAIDADPKSGWAIYPEVGKAHSAVFEFERPVELGCGLMLTVTLDFQSQYGQHQLGCFRLSATTSANPHNSDTLPANVRAALTVPRANRTAAQEADLTAIIETQIGLLSGGEVGRREGEGRAYIRGQGVAVVRVRGRRRGEAETAELVLAVLGLEVERHREHQAAAQLDGPLKLEDGAVRFADLGVNRPAAFRIGVDGVADGKVLLAEVGRGRLELDRGRRLALVRRLITEAHVRQHDVAIDRAPRPLTLQALVRQRFQAKGSEVPLVTALQDDGICVGGGVRAAREEGLIALGRQFRPAARFRLFQIEEDPFRPAAERRPLPCRLSLIELRVRRRQFALRFLDRRIEFAQPLRLRRGRRLEHRRRVPPAAVKAILRHIVEEGVELIILLLRDGIVLMVVTLSAGGRQAEPDSACGIDAIDNVVVVILRRNGAALEVDHVIAIEAAGDLLPHRGAGQQIPGQLLDGEAIEGQVLVEGGDDPVAPARHVAAGVDVIAVGVGVAGGVEPLHRHALAEVRRRQQTIDDLLVSVRAPIGQEGIDLGGGGRQAGQVECHPPDQADRVRLGRRLEARALQTGQDEMIDGVARPGRVGDTRQGRPFRRDERPVLGPLGALVDPAAQQVDLLGRQALIRLRRRHPFAGCFRSDAD